MSGRSTLKKLASLLGFSGALSQRVANQGWCAFAVLNRERNS